MGVINMAHGEFIMIGAYTGYVVQTLVPNETASLAIAIRWPSSSPSWRAWRWSGW
jgi:branched-subunit amino acid ABC-type transport system permease component